MRLPCISITADALLTQREFACHLIEDRQAQYHFTVKTNQKYVGQAFATERKVINKRIGKASHEIIYGITSAADFDASPLDILHTNRKHWCIENSWHY